MFLRPTEQLLAALAPEGWEQSPLYLAFHPTDEQRRAESEIFTRNLAAMGRTFDVPPDEEEKEVEQPEIADPADERPVNPQREVLELMGLVLWDVFSNNNSVLDPNGDKCDVGSFRGSADVIAEELNVRYAELGVNYDYLDFYMGSLGIGRRTDLGPVYRFIFSELREAGCNWEYNYSRMHIVSFGGGEAPDSELSRTVARMNVEGAKRERESPPAIISAYQAVFGEAPDGWPP